MTLLVSADECFYCGEPNPTTMDHLLPRGRGGSNDPINLVPCCRSCNSSKGMKTPGEFAAHRRGCRLDSILSHKPRTKTRTDVRAEDDSQCFARQDAA